MPPGRRSKPRSALHRALGEAIEELREADQLTIEQLAEQAEMRFQLVSDLERGVTDPKLSTLERMSEGLRVDVGKLMTRAAEIRGERRRPPEA